MVRTPAVERSGGRDDGVRRPGLPRDPERHARRNQYQREYRRDRYATDPEWRDPVRARDRERRRTEAREARPSKPKSDC